MQESDQRSHFLLRKRNLHLKLVFIPIVALLAACDTPLVKEAKKAESDGRVISNEMMAATYPSSFRSGNPQYLERDFEAGADFICDEIKAKKKRDICAEESINWR